MMKFIITACEAGAALDSGASRQFNRTLSASSARRTRRIGMPSSSERLAPLADFARAERTSMPICFMMTPRGVTTATRVHAGARRMAGRTARKSSHRLPLSQYHVISRRINLNQTYSRPSLLPSSFASPVAVGPVEVLGLGSML